MVVFLVGLTFLAKRTGSVATSTPSVETQRPRAGPGINVARIRISSP